MYSRRKGKSGSKKPIIKVKPTWMPIKEKEVELLIAKLAKDGQGPSEIGLHLRDSYGIPDTQTVLGKSITQVLKEKKLQGELPEDVLNLMSRVVQIGKHFEQNHKDMTAKRGLQLTESKILRLVKYYKKTGRIAAEWKYNRSQASFYVE